VAWGSFTRFENARCRRARGRPRGTVVTICCGIARAAGGSLVSLFFSWINSGHSSLPHRHEEHTTNIMVLQISGIIAAMLSGTSMAIRRHPCERAVCGTATGLPVWRRA